ncbi:MAG TPA: hypothetical protein VI233_09795, partial [Puia sp.]
MKSFFIDIFRRNIYLLLVAFVLFLSGYFLNLYFNSDASVAVQRNSIQSFLQEREFDFEKVAGDTALLHRLISRQYSAKELEKIDDKKYGLFLYRTDSLGVADSLRFWNDQRSLPTQALEKGPDGAGFIQLSNGQYEYIRKTVIGPDGKPLVAIALIPIRWQYYIATSNLTPEFVDNPAAEVRVSIETTPTEFPVKSRRGPALFYLQKKPNYHASAHNWQIPMAILFGLLLILIIIHNIAHTVRER